MVEFEGIISPGTSGIYIDEAKNVTVLNCIIKWGPNRPDYYGYALLAQNTENLVLKNSEGSHAHQKDVDGFSYIEN